MEQSSISFIHKSTEILKIQKAKHIKQINEPKIMNEAQNINENIQVKEVYSMRPMYSYNDIDINAESNKADLFKQYNNFINTILTRELIQSKYINEVIREKEIINDYAFIKSVKEKMIRYRQYYSNELLKIIYDKSRRIDKKEDIKKKNDITDISQEKEKSYKEAIHSLLMELKHLTKDNVDIDLIKEISDFMNMNTSSEVNLSFSKGVSNSSTTRRTKQKPLKKIIEKIKSDEHVESSLLEELDNFKKEEKLYQFEIPPKYVMSQFVKCKKEKQIKGRLVRFYENKVIDIIGKKKTITRIFPDGYEIWFYNNKDVEQRFPNGRIYYFYNRNKSSEFRFLNDNYLVYKFPNGQYEKHYFDNSVNIKFTDGSYRIIKQNTENLYSFLMDRFKFKIRME